MADDGLAYVKRADEAESHPPVHVSAAGAIEFPDELLLSVIDAAEECPGECIFIEE